jgi:hypothetical protein
MLELINKFYFAGLPWNSVDFNSAIRDHTTDA